MREKLKVICQSIHPLSVKNVADSCIGFMKKYFNEYKKKVEGELVYENEWKFIFLILMAIDFN